MMLYLITGAFLGYIAKASDLVPLYIYLASVVPAAIFVARGSEGK